MRKLTQPQTTLAVGEPSFANGVRKGRPLTPLTKCGMPLVRKAAAMKWAI